MTRRRIDWIARAAALVLVAGTSAAVWVVVR